jgi:phage tail sheath protein FI
MGTMKTPGVYIVEKKAFPNTVVEVATAVPAFNGYTEKADNKGKSLDNKAWRITSMAEFHDYYGYAPKPKFSIVEDNEDAGVEADFKVDGKERFLQLASKNFLLYRSMQLFFQNGGGPCYIVSVGGYSEKGSDPAVENDITAANLLKGIKPLIKEQEPTMVVIPETVSLAREDSQKVQQAVVAHCGDKMKNRVAILDIHEGFREQSDPYGNCVAFFRDDIGTNKLDFATAYYPWINTSMLEDSDVSFDNVENQDKLTELLTAEAAEANAVGDSEEDDVKTAAVGKLALQIAVIGKIEKADTIVDDKYMPPRMVDKSLVAMSPLYKKVMAAIKFKLNQLPPAAAMAGIYTRIDNSRGVWKAPANTSLSAVVSPTVNISHDEQENLNVDTNGKSINAIRSFIGEGTLVWGARTLDGNSLDWRYISVRRTMIMLEESIRLASKAYVFEPNDANTWVTMKSMIRNFLTGIWKRGGLAGAVPEDAFSVHVGLGDTMTGEDILEGILRISVFVAVTRPAEFIEITFQQQMQKS